MWGLLDVGRVFIEDEALLFSSFCAFVGQERPHPYANCYRRHLNIVSIEIITL